MTDDIEEVRARLEKFVKWLKTEDGDTLLLGSGVANARRDDLLALLAHDRQMEAQAAQLGKSEGPQANARMRKALERIAAFCPIHEFGDGCFAAEPPEWAKDYFNGDRGERCGLCGAWCTVVRPGKTQCNNCSDGRDRDTILGSIARQALSAQFLQPQDTSPNSTWLHPPGSQGGPAGSEPTYDPWTLATYDDGTSVHLEGYTGDAHPLGAWGALTLQFRAADGMLTTRRYAADGPAHSYPVQPTSPNGGDAPSAKPQSPQYEEAQPAQQSAGLVGEVEEIVAELQYEARLITAAGCGPIEELLSSKAADLLQRLYAGNRAHQGALTAAEALVVQLVEGLRPFAKISDRLKPDFADHWNASLWADLPASDFRRAAALVAKVEGRGRE